MGTFVKTNASLTQQEDTDSIPVYCESETDNRSTCNSDSDGTFCDDEEENAGSPPITARRISISNRSVGFTSNETSDTLESSINLDHETTSTSILKKASILESTIRQVSRDLEEFGSEIAIKTSPASTSKILSTSKSFDSSSARGTSSSRIVQHGSPTIFRPIAASSPSCPDVASTQGKAVTPVKFTSSQQLQENLYDSIGKKPCNLADEHQLLYQTLDFERKNLMKRKALFNFMYGAIRKSNERSSMLQSKFNAKREECAARLIFHSLLLQAYRKLQAEISNRIAENTQLEKNIENLCLQLRVVKHCQNVEKEKAVEKAHEIASLKTEIEFVKKNLNKTKNELSSLQNDCSKIQGSNSELMSQKFMLEKQLQIFEEKNTMLESSFDLERKRIENYVETNRRMKRQLMDARSQIEDIEKQCDKWQHKTKLLEAKNWELQTLMENRGEEFSQLAKNRDTYKIEAEYLQRSAMDLKKRNDLLEQSIFKEESRSSKLGKDLELAEHQLKCQCSKIEILQANLIQKQKDTDQLRKELMQLHRANYRKRRSWLNFATPIVDPYRFLASFVTGETLRN